MRRVQSGHAVLEHTTDREERSEDDDSISGVCASDGCTQGLQWFFVRRRGRIGACVLGLPLRL